MRDINEWPYNGNDGMTANFKANNGLWTETNEETFYDQMECVPPRILKHGAFMVGEWYSGRCAAVFVEINGRFFGKICNVLTFNVVNYTKEIKNQFGME